MDTISKESIVEVFSDLIISTIHVYQIEISPLAETYVIEVVSDLSAAAHTAASRPAFLPDLLRQGLDSQGRVRQEYLRATGDVALFISGIFPDSLESRRNWYTLGDFIDIGKQAYGNIHSDVFDELSEKFPEVVEVLNSVSEKINLLSTDIHRYIRRRATIDARLVRR